MIKHLISHHRKSTSRSVKIADSTGVRIAYWFFIGLMLIYLLLAGFFIDKIIGASFPDEDPITIFNSFMLYYLAGDLFMRFYLQDVPILGVIPYLHLPVKRSKMIHFMLSKSLTSLFNFLPLFIFVPFALKVVIPTLGFESGLIWFLGIYGLMLSNNFLGIYLKRHMVGNMKIILGFLMVIALLIAAHAFKWIDIFAISSTAMSAVLSNPIFLLIIAGLIMLTYWLNYSYLRQNIYLEEIDQTKAKGDFKAVNTSFLKRYGHIGSLISMELKLIFRNKRPKALFMMSILLLFYGLIFYPNKLYIEGFGMLTFVGVFITGIFLSNYGQMLLSWNSGFFDKIMTSNLGMREYFESKFWLFFVTSSAAFILSIPYVYFGWKVVAINFACYLFNIGVNAFVIFYFSMRNPKRIDLTKGASFNYEGVTSTQFILMLPVLLFPILLVLPFSWMGIPWVGIGILGVSGIIGFLMKDTWFNKIEQRYQNKKYELAEGFRQE